jgi:uncharacterized RDD family membrane protein YckC
MFFNLKNKPMEEQSFNETYSPLASLEYASVGQRFLNYLIDLVVLYIVAMGMSFVFILASYVMGEQSGHGFLQELLLVLMIILGVIYYAFCEGASGGRSVGKLITRTKVVRDDGSEISWKDALIRSLCRMIPFEPLTAFGGYPLHDRLSHTKVIRIKE